ncbi:30S ribosomal protein S20 [Rossellomorea marisflavi]|uniref:30S ribosomal protein S20 n=1 Tax=Rossellomorea marisflavi TaxID=189381 RepID=UPI001EE1F51D|nr:30S ribosomal protein S20 [Rossellomorea marisflavi]UKS64101.1 30S ribosomal protein S20 [Rossellomorea marisflavi]
MPNIKSAIKRVRTNNERNVKNAAVKSSMRTAIKKAEAAATNNEDNAQELAKVAVSQLDKAAQKGLIHKNTADRQKARLMKKAN